MLLHETMDAAVVDVHAEPTSLAAASRRQGRSIRRRRHALATVGAAAVIVVLAAGAWAALPGGGSDDEVATETTSAPPPVIGLLSGVTAPITDSGVAAAFADAVADVAEGTSSQVQGQAVDNEASAELLFVPSTGAGPAGRVMVNLQPLSYGGPKPYTCQARYMTDCGVRTLPNGDTLRTYHDDGDTEFGGAESQRAVAELLSPTRRIRVVVFAMNTNARDKGTFRDQTVLGIDQLTEIATQPWWSRTELPREYVDASEQLTTSP